MFRYDVIILPSGSYSDVLSERRLEEVQNWLRGGGRLIALGSATRFLAGKDSFGLKIKPDEEDKDEDSLSVRLRPYADRHRHGITEDVTGAIFRTEPNLSLIHISEPTRPY